jgi:hypothetical protein
MMSKLWWLKWRKMESCKNKLRMKIQSI